MDSLHRCVTSLYDDQVRPTLAIIRRRYQELEGKEVSLPELAERLGKAPWARLTGPAANPSALLLDRALPFVDPLDPSDPYPPELWAALDKVLDDMAVEGACFRGGRYGCAQELKNLKLLAGYSLGQVQHMVQLLIERMHLRYVRSGKGTLAPRARSCCSTASSSGSRGNSPQKGEEMRSPHVSIGSLCATPPLRFEQLAWGPPASGTPWAGLWMSPLCALPVDGAHADAEPSLEAEVAKLVDSPPPSPRGLFDANTSVAAAPALTQRFEWVVPSSKLRSKDKVAVSRVLDTATGSFKMLLTPRGENFAASRQATLQLKCLDPTAALNFRFCVGGERLAAHNHCFGRCAVSPAVLVDLPTLRPSDVGLAVSVEVL